MLVPAPQASTIGSRVFGARRGSGRSSVADEEGTCAPEAQGVLAPRLGVGDEAAAQLLSPGGTTEIRVSRRRAAGRIQCRNGAGGR